MEQSITEEEQIVEKMNEDKMINALNTNVELGCLQTDFDKAIFVILGKNLENLEILAVSRLCDGEENLPGKQREREDPEEVFIICD